jgi:hypothetical protein
MPNKKSHYLNGPFQVQLFNMLRSKKALQQKLETEENQSLVELTPAHLLR